MLGTLAMLLLGQRYFFVTGQQAVVSTIRWAPGFVGLDDAPLALSGAFVTASFFAGPLLAVAWALPPDCAPAALLRVVVARSALALASMVTVAPLRRHLMVWKIFAPR